MRPHHSKAWCAQVRARVLKALEQVPGIEVIVPGEDVTPLGIIQNDDQAVAALNFFKDKDVDGVLIGALDFADEVSAAHVATSLKKPILLFGTKEPEADSDNERMCDAFCGTISIATALHRRKAQFVFAGILFPEEPKFIEEVTTFTSACAAAKAFLGARVGQVGVRPERFETVAYSEVELLTHFGQKIVPLELSEVVAATKALTDDDPRVRRAADEIASEPTLLNVNANYLTNAAKFELALGDFFTRRHLSALAVQCWPALGPQLGIAACATFGRLTGKGLMTACEVDVIGALDMLTQYNLAMQSKLPHFIDWTIQHRNRPNTFLAWHCGNAPASLAAENSEIRLRNRRRSLDTPIPDDDRGAAVLDLKIKPGLVTMNRLVEYDGEFKMLIAKGTIVDDPKEERGSYSWVEVPSLDNLYNTLINEGFIHHASMIHGDYSKAMEQFCKFVGIKTVIV